MPSWKTAINPPVKPAATANTDNVPAGRQAPSPQVWLIEPYRAGERSQTLALAEVLQWPFETKRLRYRKFQYRTSLFRGSDLGDVDLAHSDALTPPWPDLVISAGMRNEPVCRWIREQSGGRTRIVHVGRPWADPERFDLVVTTPQYRLPSKPSVLQNGLTLHRVSAERLEQAAAVWGPRLRQLPRPYVAVIVGGNSGPYTLGPHAARRLTAQACALARRDGGSLLVTTSSRTPAAAADALVPAIDVPANVYRWRASDAANPYMGYLALADSIIVTGDSIAMLSEACATTKPVYLFDLGCRRQSMRFPHEQPPGRNDFRLTAWLYRALMRFGPQRLSRDITLVHRQLLETGRICWLDEADSRVCSATPQPDLQRATARIRSLFPDGNGQ